MFCKGFESADWQSEIDLVTQLKLGDRLALSSLINSVIDSSTICHCGDQMTNIQG